MIGIRNITKDPSSDEIKHTQEGKKEHFKRANEQHNNAKKVTSARIVVFSLNKHKQKLQIAAVESRDNFFSPVTPFNAFMQQSESTKSTIGIT